MFWELRISNRLRIRPASTLALSLCLIAALIWQYNLRTQAPRVISVEIISNWHIRAEIQQLLAFTPNNSDLPEYKPLPGAPNGMDEYAGGNICISGQTDPRDALFLRWSDLSPNDRSATLSRLGFSPQTSMRQLISGPFPDRPWARKHGYSPMRPNQSFNSDATSASHFHHRHAPLR